MRGYLPILVLMVVLYFISCASMMPTDTQIERAWNSGKIRIGSTTQEVYNAGIQPTYSGCVKQKITADGTMELWDFATKACGANLANSYVLIFQDGRLIEIRSVSSIYDVGF